VLACFVGLQPQVQQCRDDQSGEFDGECRAHADCADQYAAQRRTGELADLDGEGVQRDRGRHLLVSHHSREERVPARPLQRRGDRVETAADVDEQHLRVVEQGVAEQHGADDGLRDTGADQHLPAIDVVRECAAVQAEHDQRGDRHQAHRADGEVRVGQLVQLIRQRDVPDHAAEEEDRTRDRQDAEVARTPPGSQIDAEPGQPLTDT